MTNRYTFGFPTSIKGISFPGRPRIITAEVNGVTVNPGNYSYNGETFVFSAAKPVGPNNVISGIGLVPGTAGMLGLPTFKGLKAPALVNPFSTDMMNRLYAWQQPVPGYISSDETTGAAVLFLDLDNVVALYPKLTSYSFAISTGSHGSSTPPGPPQIIWFWYSDPLNINANAAAAVNATGDFATQTFLDITDNINPPNFNIADRTVAANPVAVSAYGQTLFSVCSMYEANGVDYGYPFGFPNGFATQSAAESFLAIYQGFGFTASAIFPWAVAPAPPPQSAECTWTIKVSTWRRANFFTLTDKGAIQSAAIVGQKGKKFVASPISVSTVSSNGGNPPACSNIITVVPSSMQFTVLQKFS